MYVFCCYFYPKEGEWEAMFIEQAQWKYPTDVRRNSLMVALLCCAILHPEQILLLQ